MLVGFVESAEHVTRPAATALGNFQGWIELTRPHVIVERWLRLSGNHVERGTVRVSLGKLRIQLGGAIEVVERLVELAGLSHQHAAIVDRPPKMRIELD